MSSLSLFKFKDDHARVAYDETYKFLDSHPEYTQIISDNLSAYRIAGELIPWGMIDSLFTQRHFPFQESMQDFEASRELCFYGFYKASYMSLKSAFEMGLLSVYLNNEEMHNEKFKKWIASKEDTPFKRHILEGLKKEPNVKLLMEKVNFEDQINSVYKILSNYSHTKGRTYSGFQQNRSNVNSFQDKSFLRWLSLMQSVTRIIIAAHLAKYPVGMQETPIEQKFGINGPVGMFIEPGESEFLKGLLGDVMRNALQEISDNDSATASMVEWVNGRPDISEEEFKEQLLDFDKFMIEMNGWNSWGKQKWSNLSGAEDKGSIYYQEALQEYHLLEKWAKENNFIESKYERDKSINQDKRDINA
ncbi:MAG: hypothetical protein MOGMAGMI_01641 [Candidatus Omnitrophica bacterium]|nr:hypothetical protein [Candidatus Omnitrophota bacterium]